MSVEMALGTDEVLRSKTSRWSRICEAYLRNRDDRLSTKNPCFVSWTLYEVLKVQTSTFHKQAKEIFLDSSMVERTAVNRDVVGSSPTRGV